MILSSCIARFIHTGRKCWAAEKSLLASLRKKTGYTFSNCKKALDLHNNDITQAEKWLQEQAQAMGWSKATKLEGRQTTQGLVAVMVDQNHGAMVELNCETDFVARNSKFQEMAETAAKACLQYTMKQTQQRSPIMKIGLDQDQLKALHHDNKPLADHVALMIGAVGENASLRRAICFKADAGIKIAGYAHRSNSLLPGDALVGKFGAILAYKPQGPRSETTELIAQQLCQHIVGMNPLKIGSKESDTPADNADDEKCLIFQEFVLDETLKVEDLLQEHGIEVVDFRRFECGEQDVIGNPLDIIETCQ